MVTMKKCETIGKKVEVALDVGWESTKSKMSDLEDKVRVLQERMTMLTMLKEKYSNPAKVEYKCINHDKEESKVEEKETLINQDSFNVTLAYSEDMTMSVQKVILSDSNPDISNVTLVCEDKKILAHKVVLSINIKSIKEELNSEDALLYKRAFLQSKGQNKRPSSSVMEPDIKPELPVYQSRDGDLCSAEMFLQRPPPSPPYYFPPSPPQYEGSPGHQDQNYGGQVQDKQCYYRRGGKHYK